jgi:hypothetical protein
VIWCRLKGKKGVNRHASPYHLKNYDCRRRADDDDNQGGYFIPTLHKLEFPKFDGIGDLLPWLNRCERYFHIRRTPEHQRVSFTSFYLHDSQLWFHRMELNGGQPTWPQFVQLVNARFNPPLADSPIGELAMLRRKGSVDDYSARFMALSYRDPSLTEYQQIHLYITGHDNPLHMDVALQQPATLDDTVIFARAYEQRNASREVAPPQHQRQPARAIVKTQSANVVPTEGGAPSAMTTETMWLTPVEIAQHQKEGRYFHCHNMFTNGHKKVCKQLFIIEVVGDDDKSSPPDNVEAPIISLHALTGIRPHSGRTMQLVVTINGTCLTALLDSGSTHNFVDVEAAARVSIQLGPPLGLHVAVTNRDHVPSLGYCRHMLFSIADELFVIDCYGIALNLHEMVLDVQ